MALTKNRNTPVLGAGGVPVNTNYPVATGVVIYPGALVAKNATGYLVPASADNTLICVGTAAPVDGLPIDNSAGSNGAVSCPVIQGVARYANSNAMTLAAVGGLCYAVDDESVSTSNSGGSRPIAGTVYLVDSNGVWVYVGLAAPVDGTSLTAFMNNLASTSPAEGAALVGIADAGTYTSATTVEAALQELYAKTLGLGLAPQALSGAGAVNVTSLVTLFTSTGDAQALTLADGTVTGQLKVIHHTVDGGSGVLTPTTPGNFATITLTNIHEWAALQWSGSAWNVIAASPLTVIA